MTVDVVYLVKPGDRNNELRMSLRTLANLPHRRVWFAGYLPSWATNVDHIPGNRFGRQKPMNVYDNVRLACEHPDVSAQFVIMNDDFFILQPDPVVRVLARCTLDHHVDSILAGRTDRWARSMQNTRTWLHSEGIEDPMSYELHRPTLIDKTQMLETMDRIGEYGHPLPPQWRTAYGALFYPDVELVNDCKIAGRPDDLASIMAMPTISTVDHSFPYVRPRLKALFPNPSTYEGGEEWQATASSSTLRASAKSSTPALSDLQSTA